MYEVWPRRHLPQSVTEDEQVKLMWDTTILTDKCLESNRIDITFVYKSRQEWILIDFTIPWDKNIVKVKIESYRNLAG